jgi:hypothetical protein
LSTLHSAPVERGSNKGRTKVEQTPEQPGTSQPGTEQKLPLAKQRKVQESFEAYAGQIEPVEQEVLGEMRATRGFFE